MSDTVRQPVAIRDARPEELQEVADLIVAANQEYGARAPAEAFAGYLQRAADVWSRLEESELIVAEQTGQLVGTVTFYPDGPRSSGEGWPPGWSGIRLLAVHPDARGQGIAGALMRECLRRSRERNVHTVGLHTTELMEIARGMYERMGFLRAPEFDFYPMQRAPVMAYRLDI